MTLWVSYHLLLLRMLSTNECLRSHFPSPLYLLRYELGSVCHSLLSTVLCSATITISSFYLTLDQQLYILILFVPHDVPQVCSLSLFDGS